MKHSITTCLVLLLWSGPVLAQSTPKSIALTDKSQIEPKDLLKPLQKECPDVSITNDVGKSEYTLEAMKTVAPSNNGSDGFNFTLFDHDGKIVRSTSTALLGNAMKDICRAIKNGVVVEVVDAQNLTQSIDARNNGGIVPALTGRQTHTDTATINVIVKGEHAALDCYEHRTGCTTIGPGKYYGEFDGESLWIDYEMPLTHKPVRNHYKIAGSW
jgi:hypothetical protein